MELTPRTLDDESPDITHNDVTVGVRHTGDPPELFRPGIPVVLEGHWAADTDVFESDRILIKHDETYESREDYDGRMRQTERRQPPATPRPRQEGTSRSAGRPSRRSSTPPGRRWASDTTTSAARW